jgi:hypothetical protein
MALIVTTQMETERCIHSAMSMSSKVRLLNGDALANNALMWVRWWCERHIEHWQRLATTHRAPGSGGVSSSVKSMGVSSSPEHQLCIPQLVTSQDLVSPHLTWAGDSYPSSGSVVTVLESSGH